MVAIARQQNIIEVRGVDNASVELNKVSKSLAGLQKQSAKAGKAGKKVADEFGKGFADAGDQAAGRAGKLSTALSSLGDFAGKSEGKFRQASEAAGAFDDVLTLLPGPAGLAAAAVAGITVVMVLQEQAARQTKAALEQAFGQPVVSQLQRLGGALNLNREAMLAVGQAAQDTNRPIAGLESELARVVQRAEDIGEDGSAAVIRFAKSLGEAATDADRLRGKLRALGIEAKHVDLSLIASPEQRAEAKKASAEFEVELAARQEKFAAAKEKADASAAARDLRLANERRASLGKAFRNAEEREAVGIAIAFDRKVAAADAGRKRVALRELNTLIDGQQRVIASVKKAAADEAKIKREAAAGEFAAADEANAKQAKETAARDAKRRDALRAKGGASAERKAAAKRKVEQESARLAEENLQILLTLDRQRLETKALELKAQAALAVTDADRIRSAKALAAFEQSRALKDLQAKGGTISEDQKRRRLAAIKTIGDLELKARIKSIKESSAKSKAEQGKQDLDAIADRIKSFGDAISAKQMGEAGSAINDVQKGLKIASDGAADVARNLNNVPKAAAAAAGAIAAIGDIAVDADTKRSVAAIDADTKARVSTAKTEKERAAIIEEGERKKADAVEKGERRKAAMMMLVEAARAVAAGAGQNWVAAAGHGVAAVMFGAIASGAVGTSAPGGGGGGGGIGGGGGFTGGGAGAAADADASGAGVTQIFNFNQPLVTKQVIGKAVMDSQRSLRMTGHAQANGV